MAFVVREYITADGANPFRRWLARLATDARARILLLVGGDKRSQAKDITQAKLYWAHYREETKHGKT